MRVVALQHERDTPIGAFEHAIADGDHSLAATSFALADLPAPTLGDADALIVLGGGVNVDERERAPWIDAELDFLRDAQSAGVPMLGVCLGAQLLSASAGAEVTHMECPQIGWRPLLNDGLEDPLLAALPERFTAFEWHSCIAQLPRDALALSQDVAGLQAFRLPGRTWGIQFHAEVTQATIGAWIADYKGRPPERRPDVDWDAMAAETELRIESSNALGRRLCARFLELADA